MDILLYSDKSVVVRNTIRDVIDSLSDVKHFWDAHNDDEAFAFIRQQHPNVVLISQDYEIPDLLNTIRTIIEVAPQTRVLVVSMHNDSRFALRVIEAGASGYLLQDRLFEELENAVRTVISQHTYLSPGVAGIHRY